MSNDEKKIPPAPPAKTVAKREGKKKNIFSRTLKWFREMRSELKKVMWPTPKQIRNNTGIALFFMAIAAVVVWGFDEIASITIQAIITVTR